MEVLPVRGVQSIVAPRVQNVLPVAVEGQVHLKQKVTGTVQLNAERHSMKYEVPETVKIIFR
jgi:hypothetical protein